MRQRQREARQRLAAEQDARVLGGARRCCSAATNGPPKSSSGPKLAPGQQPTDGAAKPDLVEGPVVARRHAARGRRTARARGPAGPYGSTTSASTVAGEQLLRTQALRGAAGDIEARRWRQAGCHRRRRGQDGSRRFDSCERATVTRRGVGATFLLRGVGAVAHQLRDHQRDDTGGGRAGSLAERHDPTPVSDLDRSPRRRRRARPSAAAGPPRRPATAARAAPAPARRTRTATPGSTSGSARATARDCQRMSPDPKPGARPPPSARPTHANRASVLNRGHRLRTDTTPH